MAKRYHVMFTDESRFCIDMNDARAKVWRRRGERYADCCVRECSRFGGGSVMVWAVYRGATGHLLWLLREI